MTPVEKAPMVHESSGNVFADLGCCDPESRLFKANLAERICREVVARGLTQKKASELMELDQPKISALMRGKLKGFSTDRLFRCLTALGQEVEIVIRPTLQMGRRGEIRVVEASHS